MCAYSFLSKSLSLGPSFLPFHRLGRILSAFFLFPSSMTLFSCTDSPPSVVLLICEHIVSLLQTARVTPMQVFGLADCSFVLWRTCFHSLLICALLLISTYLLSFLVALRFCSTSSFVNYHSCLSYCGPMSWNLWWRCFCCPRT